MENQMPPIVTNILDISDRYLAKYGKLLLGVYRFHDVESKEFSKFLNSLQITLRRKAIIPTYGWLYDRRNQCYNLIIYVYGGFGRRDLNDLFPIIERLWKSHSSYPIHQVECIAVNMENCQNIKDWLLRLLLSIGGTIGHSGSAPHTRTFATSKMP